MLREADVIQYYGGELGEPWDSGITDQMQKMFDSIME